ncbi:MAG: hypothetical protein O2857_04605 [Planctomycetota bacterium]|nr:hypothetical protein [Planctomycetota bacterium]
MNNPYQGIDWDSIQRVPSATHMHIYDQSCLDNGYRYGIRHFPISNYYPSAPCNAGTRRSDFLLRQSWPVMRDGAEVSPPINWNEVITWADELDEEFRSTFPFEESEPLYTNIPEDIIISSNAEHHGFTNSNCHICAPGSSFRSGTFDAVNRHKLQSHGFAVGYGKSWQEGFAAMIDALDYPNGGGVMLNHPTWFTQFSDEVVFEMLDFDDRVLGIEIYNDYSATRDWFQNPNYVAPDEPEQGFSLNLWNRILGTGRRCWASCVPDHSVCKGKDWNGRNVLLIPTFTEEECLRAYRAGNFYGCLKDNGLTIKKFEASATQITVTTSREATIRFISDRGELKSVSGLEATVDIPLNDGKPDLTFVRVELADDSGERVFMQPVMFGN